MFTIEVSGLRKLQSLIYTNKSKLVNFKSLKIQLQILLLIILFSCYPKVRLDGFDKEAWAVSLTECTGYREEHLNILLQQKEILLEKNQNQIQELLGTPTRHELFSRNQKFFFYQLECDSKAELRLRFDALGRLKELRKIGN